MCKRQTRSYWPIRRKSAIELSRIYFNVYAMILARNRHLNCFILKLYARKSWEKYSIRCSYYVKFIYLVQRISAIAWDRIHHTQECHVSCYDSIFSVRNPFIFTSTFWRLIILKHDHLAPSHFCPKNLASIFTVSKDFHCMQKFRISQFLLNYSSRKYANSIINRYLAWKLYFQKHHFIIETRLQ